MCRATSSRLFTVSTNPHRYVRSIRACSTISTITEPSRWNPWRTPSPVSRVLQRFTSHAFECMRRSLEIVREHHHVIDADDVEDRRIGLGPSFGRAVSGWNRIDVTFGDAALEGPGDQARFASVVEHQVHVTKGTSSVAEGETNRGPCGGVTTDDELCDAGHRQ